MSTPTLTPSPAALPAATGYSLTRIVLHWAAAGLILAQFVLHEPMSDAWDAVREGLEPVFDPLVAAHVVGGVLVLALAVWRLVLRRAAGPARRPQDAAGWVAALVHIGLYAAMIGLAVTGGMAWFGGQGWAAEIHEAAKPVLLALVAMHVAGALWHRFWLRDDVMARMVRPQR